MDLVQARHLDFPTPKNLNYWWTFGAILAIMLVVQLITGIVLAMHYTPHVSMAFDSVEHIMRDVNYGWLLRYLHANGASMFFVAVYIHIFRGMYYGSYKAPREVLWMIGVLIFLVMMATAFMGYVLPWGQMSFWGAKVITNLFSAIPFFGETITTWLWGGYAVDNPTLNRFFSLHYLLPFVLAGLVGLHIWALHVPGNNNPTGVNVRGRAGHGALPSLLHDEGWLRDCGVPDRLCGLHLLRAELSRPRDQLSRRPIRWRRRRISCRNGTICRSTRSCAPSPTSLAASSPCSARSSSCSCCRGSTPRGCARAPTGRSSSSSSGSS